MRLYLHPDESHKNRCWKRTPRIYGLRQLLWFCATVCLERAVSVLWLWRGHLHLHMCQLVFVSAIDGLVHANRLLWLQVSYMQLVVCGRTLNT